MKRSLIVTCLGAKVGPMWQEGAWPPPRSMAKRAALMRYARLSATSRHFEHPAF